MEFDVPAAVAVFFSSMAIDALSAYYVQTTSEGHPGRAAITSMVIGILGYLNLSIFIADTRMAIPEILGGGIGTYLIVRRGRSKVSGA